jgi:hypothetical protein
MRGYGEAVLLLLGVLLVALVATARLAELSVSNCLKAWLAKIRRLA